MYLDLLMIMFIPMFSDNQIIIDEDIAFTSTIAGTGPVPLISSLVVLVVREAIYVEVLLARK